MGAWDKPDDEAPHETDICTECGKGIMKPDPIPLNPFMSFQPPSLCPPCDETRRWREQICITGRPYKLPQWRPKETPPCT